QPALHVDVHETPETRPRAILPPFGSPGVMTRFPRPRHSMEFPDQLSRARIESARIAARPERRPLLRIRPDNHQVAIDRGRRRHAVPRAWEPIGNASAQIDRAVVPEPRDRFAALGI